MFKDAKEELKRLEAELLAEDPIPEDTLPEETPEEDILDDTVLEALLEETQKIGNAGEYQNYSNDYGTEVDDRTRVFRVYNTDKSDEDLDNYAQAVQEEPQKNSLTGLIITACLLTAGILGMLVWWLLRYWGAG